MNDAALTPQSNKIILHLIAMLTCAISCSFSVNAAIEEPVTAESPSQESRAAAGKAEEKTEVLYTSTSGAVRLERTGEDIWVVSAKDPAQRAKLPKIQILGDWAYPDEFEISPNDEWIFAPYHVGSCLRDSVLYRRGTDKIATLEEFNDLAWRGAVKLGAFKKDVLDDGCAMTGFGCWSIDSGRLLIHLRGGEDKRAMQERYLYFNTRKQQFELTNYLRKLNKPKSEMLVCAEPVDPLPSEAELKSRFDAMDRQLNERYAEVIAKVDKDQVSNVRQGQRNWIKHRDEGTKVYVSLFPPAEKEQRRLQFLCDVTAARIETQPAEAWGE
jgi:uncharacterized protein YecT (DUF1311 family)